MSRVKQSRRTVPSDTDSLAAWLAVYLGTAVAITAILWLLAIRRGSRFSGVLIATGLVLAEFPTGVFSLAFWKSQGLMIRAWTAHGFLCAVGLLGVLITFDQSSGESSQIMALAIAAVIVSATIAVASCALYTLITTVKRRRVEVCCAVSFFVSTLIAALAIVLDE